MDELIDSEIKLKKRKSPYRIFNSLLIAGSFLFLAFTYYRIDESKYVMDSPLLPEYTPYYINNSLINISAFLFMSLFPALFLRMKKHYIISSVCILIFSAIGVFLKNRVLIYEYFI